MNSSKNVSNSCKSMKVAHLMKLTGFVLILFSHSCIAFFIFLKKNQLFDLPMKLFTRTHLNCGVLCQLSLIISAFIDSLKKLKL